ncbi:hypothetical protein GIB67_032792 [Kingdonia uniflora]|uniref:Phosphoribosylglycinamide formyltransferase, chloroplastic n=1 Tax=Kingdonia uniflora TaxID=39325 RepID=A0A7J7MW90_9MAGN|nr:hypothetical protein GIB67_032792 [Kingdonia uniflora]
MIRKMMNTTMLVLIRSKPSRGGAKNCIQQYDEFELSALAIAIAIVVNWRSSSFPTVLQYNSFFKKLVALVDHSMDAQSLIFGLSTKPILQTPPKASSLAFIPTQSWKSFKTNYSPTLLSQKIGAKRILECSRSVERIDDSIGIQRKKIAVFVSGGGSNFRSIYTAAVGGLVHGDVAVLVTNKPVFNHQHVTGCGGAQYARDEGIPVLLFPETSDVPEGLSTTELVTSLRKFKVDFILLAGYLKLLPTELIRAYPKAILNIHPSLLPAFGGKGYYGMKVHKAVIASGARYSGPTVHYVDEHYDTGRILAQRAVPVLANDTAEELATRVLHEEHQLYVEVTSALCEERIAWREDGVPLIRRKENPNKYSRVGAHVPVEAYQIRAEFCIKYLPYLEKFCIPDVYTNQR